MSLLTEAGGIFLASDPRVGVRFQLWPDRIEDSKSVDWTSIPVVGRAEPIQAYHSSSAQVFSFELMFTSSLDASDNELPSDVQNKVNFLKSLTYPQKTRAGFTTNPPVVFLIVGDLINARCVARSVSSSISGPWSIEEETSFEDLSGVTGLEVRRRLSTGTQKKTKVTLPLYAKVRIELQTVHSTPPDMAQVQTYGDVWNPSPKLDLSGFDV